VDATGAPEDGFEVVPVDDPVKVDVVEPVDVALVDDPVEVAPVDDPVKVDVVDDSGVVVGADVDVDGNVGHGR
jgi:hypothetical protein